MQAAHHFLHKSGWRAPLFCAASPPGPCRQQPGHQSQRATQICHASRCHYDVLGLQPSASASDIKSAFRKLALQLHPDINSAPNATEHFKCVKEAYEVLSDPQQRATYNRQRQARATYTRSSRSSGSSGGVQYVVYDMEGMEDIDEGFEEAAAAGFWGWYEQSGSWQSSWRSNRKKRKQHAEQQQAQQAGPQQAQQRAQRQPGGQQQQDTRRRRHHQQQQQQQARQQAQQRQARHQQQQQQQYQRHQQQFATVDKMLSQLDQSTLQAVRRLFGPNMERLQSLEELVEVLNDLEALRMQGIELNFDGTFDEGAASSGGRGRPTAAGSSSSSSSNSRTAQGGGAGYQGRWDSESGSNKTSSGSSSTRSRASSRASRTSNQGPWAGKTSKHLPRFDELSADALYEVMNSRTDRATAKAARAWVQQMLAADSLPPAFAGRLGALLAMDYVMEGLEPDAADPTDFVFGEMFDPDSERYKGRARAGSAYDYVKYTSSDDSSDDVGDDGVFRPEDWVATADLFTVLGSWEELIDSDDDYSDVDAC